MHRPTNVGYISLIETLEDGKNIWQEKLVA